MTVSSPASRRYAEALLDSSASAGADAAQLSDQLQNFAKQFTEVFELRNALLNPSFSLEERTRVLDALTARAQMPDVLRRFLRLLVSKDRMVNVHDIAESFAKFANERQGRLRAEVRTASELNEEQRDALRRALERRTGKTIELDVQVDPSLIGGVRTQVGSLVLDGSIRAHLERLRAELGDSRN